MRTTTASLALLAMALFADTPPPAEVTAEQREELALAQRDMAEAQLASIKAQSRLQAAVQAIQKTCAPRVVELDQAGKPVCAKPGEGNK